MCTKLFTIHFHKYFSISIPFKTLDDKNARRKLVLLDVHVLEGNINALYSPLRKSNSLLIALLPAKKVLWKLALSYLVYEWC